MRDEPFALSTRPPTPSADTDYDAICAAVTATARGRWFLDEFARRNRNTDTTEVLDAIARMQASLLSDRAQHTAHQANQEVRIELLEMARTIALTRAEVAERQSETARAAGIASAGAASPEIAAAAERLLQIAWTMRACGVELAASDQIGQIAQAILSADTLHNLGDQRARKLAEALHHLEQRIDRMLDGHRPGTADALDAPQPQAALQPRQTKHEPTAPDAAAIGAAIFAAAAAVEAETEPAAAPANDDIPSAAMPDAVPAPPAPEALAAVPALEQQLLEEETQTEIAETEVAQTDSSGAHAGTATIAAPEEPEQALLTEEPSAPSLEEFAEVRLPAQHEPAAPEQISHAPIVEDVAEEPAPPVRLDATEYPMDDDVVLSVAEDVVDIEPAPLPSLELSPAVVATSQPEPTPLPTTDMAPVSFTTPAPDPSSVAEDTEIGPEPALLATDEAPTLRGNHAELDVEPLAVPDEGPEAVFTGLDLEPLVVSSAVATETRALAYPIEPEPEVPAAAVTIDDALNRRAVAAQVTPDRTLPPAVSVSMPESDLGVDDDLLVPPGTAATGLPERMPIDAIERAAKVDKPADRPQAITLEHDPIAIQVDHDLDSLMDIAPADFAPGVVARAPAALPPTVQATATIEDDAADFLLEALPAPVNRARDVEPPPIPAAIRQPSIAEFTTTLTAIETELSIGVAGPAKDAKASAGVTASHVAGTTITSASSAADSTLAALMAMSEEERIALFS